MAPWLGTGSYFSAVSRKEIGLYIKRYQSYPRVLGVRYLVASRNMIKKGNNNFGVDVTVLIITQNY